MFVKCTTSIAHTQDDFVIADKDCIKSVIPDKTTNLLLIL